MKNPQSLLCGLAAMLALISSGPARAAARNGGGLGDSDLRRIVDTFAGSAVAEGRAVGIGVAVVRSGHPNKLFSYGYADWAGQHIFDERSRFEIGSVTKVFTTNLLGQAAATGILPLSTPLGSYASVLGPLSAGTARVTLGELGSFTAGYPTLAPLCGKSPVPGCLPEVRPTLAQYDAAAFASYFRNAPVPDALPAGYLYSDYSTGLVGLLLGAAPGRPLDDEALVGWHDLLQQRLLQPLHMSETELVVPSGRSDLARGYQLPVLRVEVVAGSISGVTNIAAAGPYHTPPHVTVVGGGGHGASVAARLDGTRLASTLAVTNGGTGYLAPADLVFDPPNSSTGRPATAEAIIRGDRVAGVRMIDGGLGYGTHQTVAVRISGGRRAGGRDATLLAHLVRGSVAFVSVPDGGAGYVRPVSVLVTPGEPFNSTVPIWAPAGALKSSLRDMARFAAAALPRVRSGPVAQNGDRVPEPIEAGFRIAEQPLVCQFAIPMPVQQCPSGTSLGGLAWSTVPGDPASGYPAVVFKDGGLTGFSTLVLLMPSRGVGVVVFVNSRQSLLSPATGTGAAVAAINLGAQQVAHEIMDAIYYSTGPAARPFTSP